MAQTSVDKIFWRGEFEQTLVYAPAKRPGFVAWATAFSYGDGSVGLSFDETLEAENPYFTPPRLEYAEAAGVPVSYCSVESGSAHQRSYRVYMRSADGVNFTETGRCPRQEGSFCNVGFPDGRIVGFDVPRHNNEGTGWSDWLRVRESRDGGKTWTDLRRLLQGTAPYLWRVRRLRSGTIVVLASLYGTPWGPGRERATRNTMLPGETYESKIQPFFLTSENGRNFSGPHYILPGIGAHEFDFAELPDGRLLFLAGDVQGTLVGRQFVAPSPDGWLNGTLYPIGAGAPEDPARDPQGGYVPETIAWDERHGCLVGYRRNKCFSLSNDYGENWTRIEPGFCFDFLYQPCLLALPDGRLGLYGHVGGDNAFGEKDMVICAQVFRPDCAADLPKAARLSLERMLSPDQSRYENRFCARLTEGGRPLAGQEVEFRFNTYWNEDGSVNTTAQQNAPRRQRVRTDETGRAVAAAGWYDGVADIHLAYNVDVVCPGDGAVRPCRGPQMTVLALTPRRRTPYPYDAYFAGGVLYLSPGFVERFPGALEALAALPGDGELLPEGLLAPEAVQRLARCGALYKDGGRYKWIHSVHAPRPLAGVKVMAGGDWYE
ncbi:sialidase family protein [Allofournierella sp.]|uniref:sialidase family protein n=1 Tax=Allofournierella sp. TaxID=1940256 RepID=UPI003AB38A1F